MYIHLQGRKRATERATSTTDHVDHVPSGSTELRPPRPPDHVAMMIAAKNGATTIATTVMTTGRKARGSDNFIATDQISIKDKYTSNINTISITTFLHNVLVMIILQITFVHVYHLKYNIHLYLMQILDQSR